MGTDSFENKSEASTCRKARIRTPPPDARRNVVPKDYLAQVINVLVIFCSPVVGATCSSSVKVPRHGPRKFGGRCPDHICSCREKFHVVSSFGRFAVLCCRSVFRQVLLSRAREASSAVPAVLYGPHSPREC